MAKGKVPVLSRNKIDIAGTCIYCTSLIDASYHESHNQSYLYKHIVHALAAYRKQTPLSLHHSLQQG